MELCHPLSISGALTFLGLCIGARLVIAYVAYKLPKNMLPYAAAVALIVALSWLAIYIGNLRPFGGEAGGIDSGTKPIWWNEFRPLHAGLYIAFAALAFKKNRQAYKVLLADVGLGIGLWLWRYVIC